MRILIAAATVAACATVPAEEEKVPEHGAGVCDASRVQNFIGRQRSETLGAEALRRSGARALRWIDPDTAYTQDLRGDRLNIHVTKGGRVTDLRCF